MISEPRESAVPGLASFDTAWPRRTRVIRSPGWAPVSQASSTDPPAYKAEGTAVAAPATLPSTGPTTTHEVTTAANTPILDTTRPRYPMTFPPGCPLRQLPMGNSRCRWHLHPPVGTCTSEAADGWPRPTRWVSAGPS